MDGKFCREIRLIAYLLMNSFRLFGFMRKLKVFSSVEDFFELHSRVTQGKKGDDRAKKDNFLAN